jgi:signal transduction histidine kinase
MIRQLRSSLRLTIFGVLICWLIGFVALITYARTYTWTEADIRRSCVFLAHEQLSAVPPAARAARLQELQPHFSLPLRLMPMAEAVELTSRPVAPDARWWLERKPFNATHWVFLAFDDGQSVLAVGPTNPAAPAGAKPIGLVLGIILIPLLGGFVALRIEREVAKVEAASKAFATGALDVRVENERGPSRELAASFNEMAARIERLIKSRDELVQAVSHELGSPLSRLRFHIELLEQADTTDATADRLNAMTGDLDHLDELVAELLGYVQTDDQQLQLRPIALGPTLRDLAELAHLDGHHGRAVDVDVELDPAAVEHVADPKLFQRAIENLLRNAVRYADQRVLVSTRVEDDILIVDVDDDGPGIAQDQREAVLSPFVRLEADRGRGTGGVGLGLAIVHRIVQRHGGEVTIDSAPLGGARLRTTWPCRPTA